MTSSRFALAVGMTLALSAMAPGGSTAAPPVAAAPSVDPEAVTALKRMSAYLGTLTSFEIRSETSVELVMEDDQKTEVDATLHYVVHRPDGFLIEVASDRKVRQFFYDGKSLTISAPRLGYYATVSAPPTIRQTLDLASEKYDIALPMEDLFRWSDPDQARTDMLKSAMVIGSATLGGIACDQYAFREGDIDWQIWIARGDRPVPLKVVISDRIDPARPEFVARLDWNTSPQISRSTFAFTPSAEAKAIRMAAQ